MCVTIKRTLNKKNKKRHTDKILQSYGGTYIYLWIENMDLNGKTGSKNLNCGD
jgi:hypothetical protein